MRRQKTSAAGDDGLLQAWEIYERVRIDADLVTLSACDSGSGTVRAGEGLLGLTRAFHYAGARSMLASLWSVGDKSSRWFMERFYAELARGVPQRRGAAADPAGRRSCRTPERDVGRLSALRRLALTGENWRGHGPPVRCTPEWRR